MNGRTMQIGVAIVSLLIFSSSAFAVRGRPHIDSSLGYNILLSDQNTLLRGVSLSWDGGDPYGSLPKVMPTQAQLDALANEYGLNSLHLYLEGDSTGSRSANSIGYNAADCDILVQRCANAGLYLIITIGCNGENGTMDLAWSQDFWNFYAPRYKDETHVIYEAHNEPVPNTLYSWTTSDWNDQVALYSTIRTAAPDTFILLGSFMGFVGDARGPANYLVSNGVSWSNAGFAHHGYESKVGIEEAISYMKTSTAYPALLCTEFWPGDTEGQGYNSMYESHFNGWMQFMWLGADDAKLAEFKTKINTAGTVWTPDVATCNWPAKGSPNIPADGSSVGIYDRGAAGFIRIKANNDLVADLANYTGSQNDQFIIGDAGNHMISLQADNGYYVHTGSETDSLSANWGFVEKTEKFIWIELPNGEVALRSFGGGGHLIRSAASGAILPNADNGLNTACNYVFVDGSIPTGPPASTRPYFGTPMAVPGIIQAEDFDNGGEGVAYHDTGADNQGGAYRPSEGVDIESCSEGGYDVGWTQPGEWLEYTVDVASAGDYTITTRVARGTGGTGLFHIEANGVNITGAISVSNTGGWQNWVNKTANVTLSSGVQVIKLVIDAGDINIHRMDFVLVQATNHPPTFTSNPVIRPNAAEGVAYSDTIAGEASDPEGNPLSFSLVPGGPDWLNVATNGALSGMPDYLDVGLNSWTVQVSDGTNSPVSATLQITVDNVNYAPEFTEDPIIRPNTDDSLYPDTTIYTNTIAGSATDADAGDTLTYSYISGPVWLEIQFDGFIGGYVDDAVPGLNSWIVQVDDGNGGTDTATLQIWVGSAPTPPAMSIQVSGSSLEILWPSSATGFSLYGTTNLLPPVVWSSVTNPPVIQGDSWMVDMPMDGTNQFFRLVAP